MFGAGMDDWDGDEIIRLPAERMEFTFNLLAPFMPIVGGGKALRDAPPIISESMIFPYFKGMVFCAKLANTGGWAAIDEVYKNPPLSTEQILHPEKYRPKPDLPMTIDLGTLKPGEGWKEVGRNVLGEMQTGGHAQEARGQDGRRGLGRRPLRRLRGPEEQARAGLAFNLGQRRRRPGVRSWIHLLSDRQSGQPGQAGQAHP